MTEIGSWQRVDVSGNEGSDGGSGWKSVMADAKGEEGWVIFVGIGFVLALAGGVFCLAHRAAKAERKDVSRPLSPRGPGGYTAFRSHSNSNTLIHPARALICGFVMPTHSRDACHYLPRPASTRGPTTAGAPHSATSSNRLSAACTQQTTTKSSSNPACVA